MDCLSRKLVSSGHEVTVYTSNLPGLSKYEVKDGIEIYRFRSLVSPMNNQFSPGILCKLISANDFDIVHVHSHLHMSSNMAALANLVRKRSIVLTSHGTVDYNGLKHIIALLYNKSFARMVLKSALRIIALTPAQAEILRNLGADPDKIIIIPNGIELKKINLILDTNSLKRKLKINLNCKVILFVGALTPRKGIDDLICAMKYIEQNSILLIVGEAFPGSLSFKQKLNKQIVEEGLKNIRFLGRVSQEELGYIYNVADLFVLPSHSEGLPLTLLEAMAYKKCCIVSEIPGNSEVIQNGQNGFLFQSKNPTDLAKKINFLLRNDDLRMQMGKMAGDDIETKYNFDTNYAHILETYHDVL